jgi:hypothetical protein
VGAVGGPRPLMFLGEFNLPIASTIPLSASPFQHCRSSTDNLEL